MIVGFPPGGGTDTAARFLVQKLSEPDYLGQPVIIENRPGGSGAIASEMVAKSPPDGYTLLMKASAETIQPGLRTKLPYDIERDFAAISLAGTNPFVLVVHPSLPVRSVKQLIALARAPIPTFPHRGGRCLFGWMLLLKHQFESHPHVPSSAHRQDCLKYHGHSLPLEQARIRERKLHCA